MNEENDMRGFSSRGDFRGDGNGHVAMDCGPFGNSSRGSVAFGRARTGSSAFGGGMSLAEWRDTMLSQGDIQPDMAFSVCLGIARKVDLSSKGGTIPELAPESIAVVAKGIGEVPEIGAIGSPGRGSASYCSPEERRGGRRAATSAQYSLACILFELLEGRLPPTAADGGDGKGVSAETGILSAPQNRALARALSENPAKRFPSCVSMVCAVRDGKDGRGWRPFAWVALALLACVCAAVALRREFRKYEKDTQTIVGTIENSGGGDVSTLDLLKERAAGGDDVDAMAKMAARYRDGDGVEADAAVAFQWLEKAAKAGDPDSMVAVAKAYATGDGVKADARKAAEWFGKAADAGNSEGRAAYAECLWEGRGTAQNREGAFRLAELVVDENFAVAQRIAGLCHRDGIGTAQDARKAAKWLKRGAENGDTEAQFAWSQILAQGDGVPRNVAGAVEWAKKAAEKGMPEAQVFVGECFAGGAATGTPDQAEVVRWYRMAAENGYAPAQSLLGNHLVFGLGVAKNPAEGIKWLDKAAAQKYGLAFSNLARCHAEGWGVPKNAKKAEELLKKGAELGDPDSMGEYGASLVIGKFVAKNPAEGLRWMTKAAETGRADMQLALANVLFNGLAGRVDEKAGMEWLEKAAASGLPEAQSQLAIRLQKKDARNSGKQAAPRPEGQSPQGSGERDTRSPAEKSFDLHLAAAKAGNVVSQSQVATFYYNGYGIDRDYEEAFRWYKAAAEGGDEDAMVGLANCLDKGRGTPADKKEALRWFKKAASSSNPDIATVAKRAVARLSAEGFGDATDAAEAIRIYRERAESGDIIAMYDLAQRLDEGKGVKKDPREAVKWWRKAAEIPGLRKDVGPLQIGAWVQYGVHLLDGNGVGRNSREAVKWLTKAAEDTEEKDNLGLTDANLKLKALACRRLAECYDKGDGVAKDQRQAMSWYQAGAMNGDVECNLEVGDRFADGRAGYQDPFGPQRWYERAANSGSAEGAYRAGLAYARSGALFKGKAEQWLKKAQEMGHPKAESALRDLKSGTIKPAASGGGTSGGGTGTASLADAHNKGVAAAGRGNFAEAAKWYRQAAEKGFGPSCANLGRMYYLGEGVRQDYAEAVKWYRKGAEVGQAVAQNGLAVCYLNGRGIAKNPAEAVIWFRKAAEQGYALAQHSLGACYVNGDGVRKDYNEAIKWFRKAASQGNAASQDALRQLGVR